MIFSRYKINEVEVISGENDHLIFEIVPAMGGKIISLYNKRLEKEFLWKNKYGSFEIRQRGTDYDSNFLGGIDELLPNDVPETIDFIDYPDHGELWTSFLNHSLLDDQISVFGKLTLSGLHYRKTVRMDPDQPVIYLDYSIKNETDSSRHFLWKMHAALNIEAGDQLITKAAKAQVVDPAYSRFSMLEEFNWPLIENTDASIVPGKNGGIYFFYLYETGTNEMSMIMDKGRNVFRYSYEKAVFPYQWYFASFGGFPDHYTAILEPCSSMPMQVNKAKQMNQCTLLKPGESLHTSVNIYAGENSF